MKIKEEIRLEITDKKEKLNELKIQLKKDFVGIDNIIDNVVDSMSPFYLFPDSLKRPIVINLWGMTGTGKTSLIEKIVDFLKLKKSFLKNFLPTLFFAPPHLLSINFNCSLLPLLYDYHYGLHHLPLPYSPFLRVQKYSLFFILPNFFSPFLY